MQCIAKTLVLREGGVHTYISKTLDPVMDNFLYLLHAAGSRSLGLRSKLLGHELHEPLHFSNRDVLSMELCSDINHTLGLVMNEVLLIEIMVLMLKLMYFTTYQHFQGFWHLT